MYERRYINKIPLPFVTDFPVLAQALTQMLLNTVNAIQRYLLNALNAQLTAISESDILFHIQIHQHLVVNKTLKLEPICPKLHHKPLFTHHALHSRTCQTAIPLSLYMPTKTCHLGL